MKATNDRPKPQNLTRPTPPEKPSAPVVRRIVNEKVINRKEIALDNR